MYLNIFQFVYIEILKSTLKFYYLILIVNESKFDPFLSIAANSISLSIYNFDQN